MVHALRLKAYFKRVDLEGFLNDIFIHTLLDVSDVCGTVTQLCQDQQLG